LGVSDGVSVRAVGGREHDGARVGGGPRAPGVTAVIPTLNEAAGVGWVLRRLPAVVEEVIVVDGHSSDGTVQAARAARADVVIVRADRRGKGAALQAGFAAARGAVIVMLDADGSMDPAEIEGLLARLRGGVDVVKGSRFLPAPGAGTADITPLRRLGHAALRALVNHLYGARFTDLCYGLIAFRRSALDALSIDADGFEVETQIAVHALRAGMHIEEAPSFELPRRHGVSKLRPCRDGLRVLRTITREHRALKRAARARARTPLTAGGAVAVAAGIGSRDADD
jgi:glycosyltransferase involved in cell wall biosynthesis